jgi:hypothetical protein
MALDRRWRFEVNDRHTLMLNWPALVFDRPYATILDLTPSVLIAGPAPGRREMLSHPAIAHRRAGPPSLKAKVKARIAARKAARFDRKIRKIIDKFPIYEA